jgi:hypothetical protein
VIGTTKHAPPCDLICLQVALARAASPNAIAAIRVNFRPFTVTVELTDFNPRNAPYRAAYLFHAACALAAEEKAPSWMRWLLPRNAGRDAGTSAKPSFAGLFETLIIGFSTAAKPALWATTVGAIAASSVAGSGDNASNAGAAGTLSATANAGAAAWFSAKCAG